MIASLKEIGIIALPSQKTARFQLKMNEPEDSKSEPDNPRKQIVIVV